MGVAHNHTTEPYRFITPPKRCDVLLRGSRPSRLQGRTLKGFGSPHML
jgi:hypothetical protein